MKRILVTGATGQIGSQVVAELRRTACRVRALSRNPETASLSNDEAVEVVRGDLAVPETLDAALAGVDAVFLVWLAPLAAAHRAIDRIAAAAPRVVLLTSPHRTPHPFFQQPNALRAIHAGVEEAIAASGIAWTFLRPSVFAINCRNWWAPQLANGNVVRWFHADAETAPVHERDIAAVAVRALCEEGHAGQEYVLTGPESLTQRVQLQQIGEAIGRPLQFEAITEETAREELRSVWPPPVIEMLLSAYRAAVGLPAHVTSTTAEVTGAPARSFRQWAADHAADFPRPGVRS